MPASHPEYPMAVNRRLVKKANHGKRPCSPKRQQKKRIRTPR